MLFNFAGFHSFFVQAHTGINSEVLMMGLHQMPSFRMEFSGYKKRAMENPYSRSRMVLSSHLEESGLGNDGPGRWF